MLLFPPPQFYYFPFSSSSSENLTMPMSCFFIRFSIFLRRIFYLLITCQYAQESLLMDPSALVLTEFDCPVHKRVLILLKWWNDLFTIKVCLCHEMNINIQMMANSWRKIRYSKKNSSSRRRILWPLLSSPGKILEHCFVRCMQ